MMHEPQDVDCMFVCNNVGLDCTMQQGEVRAGHVGLHVRMSYLFRVRKLPTDVQHRWEGHKQRSNVS